MKKVLSESMGVLLLATKDTGCEGVVSADEVASTWHYVLGRMVLAERMAMTVLHGPRLRTAKALDVPPDAPKSHQERRRTRTRRLGRPMRNASHSQRGELG